MGKIDTLIRLLFNSICYLKIKNPLIISAWVQVQYGTTLHRNWGDELNVYLIELLTGRKVIVTNNSLWHIIFPHKKYICIGSILGWYETASSEIWGAGALSKDIIIKKRPTAIHLVRGKYTRQLLVQQGFNCPENYGDPALLLSKLYQPNLNKKYKMGIIPHYLEEDQLFIQNYVKDHNDVCLISMSKYDNWTDVIDKINSCDYIISSSLHGLIVSDSYNIPNIWVVFTEREHDDEKFKYLDYFSSVNRNESISPIKIQNEHDLRDLYNLAYEDVYEQPDINFDVILQSCPFI